MMAENIFWAIVILTFGVLFITAILLQALTNYKVKLDDRKFIIELAKYGVRVNQDNGEIEYIPFQEWSDKHENK